MTNADASRQPLKPGIYSVEIQSISIDQNTTGRGFIRVLLRVNSGQFASRKFPLRAYTPHVLTTLAAELGISLPPDIKLEDMPQFFHNKKEEFYTVVQLYNNPPFSYPKATSLHATQQVAQSKFADYLGITPALRANAKE